MGRIFYMMGKSACGKDKLFAALASDPELSLSRLVLYTTRPIRTGETDGVQYHFVTDAQLADLEKAGRVIEKRVYETVAGPWAYATVDDGSFAEGRHFLAIGTLESYVKLRDYFGTDILVPLYLETEDGIRLARAIKREGKQASPNYMEVCRRFLSDSEDFSEEKIAAAGIGKRFPNNGELADVLGALKTYIKDVIITSNGNHTV